MRFRSFVSSFSILTFTSVFALPGTPPALHISSRNYPKHGPSSDCINGPTSRDCWCGDFSIDTDAEEKWPNTGKLVKYAFEVTEKILAPDGVPKAMMVVNGQYPGPLVTADWGDMVQIDVTNSLSNNGTSFHYHGINQVNTNTQDGANGVTECPIPPGATRRYKWQATQFGTTWYHSHHASQYGDGVLGTIQINGPATADYDIDLGIMPITDYYHISMYNARRIASNTAPIPGAPLGPPVADNGLINGTNISQNGTGHYFNVKNLIPGKKYRLRLVNTAVDNHFQVSLDQHLFTVIQADFVPVVPYNTTWLFIGIGQRYDVVFTASKPVGNYWFRAETQAGCGQNAMKGNVKAIFSYAGVKLADPVSVPVTNFTNSCADESAARLVPWVKKSVPEAEFRAKYAGEAVRETLTVELTAALGQIFFWNINNNSMVVDWQQPTLKYVAEHNQTYQTSKQLGIIELPKADTWTFWILQSTNPIPHPIHLHGHDFYLLGASPPSPPPAPIIGPIQGPPVGIVQIFSAANISALNFDSPTRRDVAMLPSGGWMVIAFETNNPGAWLLHCHIAWHLAEGLSIQFLERESEIAARMDLSKVAGNCKQWKTWYDGRDVELDSGL